MICLIYKNHQTIQHIKHTTLLIQFLNASFEATTHKLKNQPLKSRSSNSSQQQIQTKDNRSVDLQYLINLYPIFNNIIL